MLYPKGTLVKAPGGSLGVVVDNQKKEGPFARGCYVKFFDINKTLFMSELCIAIKSKEDLIKFMKEEI